MSCLPCFAKKVEKGPPPQTCVDVPVLVEEVTVVSTEVVTPPPVVEDIVVINDPVASLQISSEPIEVAALEQMPTSPVITVEENATVLPTVVTAIEETIVVEVAPSVEPLAE